MKKKTPKTKQTSTQLSSRKALDPTLPIIRIVSEEEEMHVKLGLEMEDETHDMLVEWGKEVASDEDYVTIAIRNGLEYMLEELKDENND